MAKDPDWLKALKQEAKRLGKTVHELLVEKNIKKTVEKGGTMKAAMGGMAKKKDAVKRAGGIIGNIAGKIEGGKTPPKVGGKKVPPMHDGIMDTFTGRIAGGKTPPKQGIMPARKPAKDRLGDLIRMRKGFK